jgi:hypothetical protein
MGNTAIRRLPAAFVYALTLSVGCGGTSKSADASYANVDSGGDAGDGAHYQDAIDLADSSGASTSDAAVDRVGTFDGSQVCWNDAGCGRCPTGVCCGSGCCNTGEWCDQASGTPTCRCAEKPGCAAPQICSSPLESPTMCGFICCTPNECPISRRAAKTDIVPVDSALATRLHHDLLGIDLATYRYRDEPSDSPRHLGFIIDDLRTSVPVNRNGNSVDLYAYTSMAVAAIKEQEAEIQSLRAEVAELKRMVDRRRH